MDKWQCLQFFWESFGLSAYDSTIVPSDAKLPYITYEAVTDTFDGRVFPSAHIWYRSTSWEEISLKADEISAELGRGGITIPFVGGLMWVKRGEPFAQRMEDPEDPMIRRIRILIEVEFLSEN